MLKVTEAFVNEDNYTVWSDLSGSLSSVAVLLQYTDAYAQYKMYARNLFSTVAASVGWDPKPNESKYRTEKKTNKKNQPQKEMA